MSRELENISQKDEIQSFVRDIVNLKPHLSLQLVYPIIRDNLTIFFQLQAGIDM